MRTNLLNVFGKCDFKSSGHKQSELVELTFKPNPTSGVMFARAVFEDGSFMVKQVSEGGVDANVMRFQRIESSAQRTEVIKTLYEKYTQQDIAAILDVSQGTVSAAIHSVNRR